MATDLMSRWSLSTTVIATGSSLLSIPPHSTHTLQPLDVVLFKLLSQAYSNELTNHLHKAQGLIAIKKGDFFSLFWSAWISSFTENLILKAFEATGI
jgi:hypothetical protein